MFKKKKCSRCGEKVSDKFDFCPSCGKNLRENKNSKNNWGMLGKNDFIDPMQAFKTEIRLPTGFNTIFNTLVKSLDKQFKEIDKQIGKEDKFKENFKPLKSGGISINISSLGNNPPKIKVKSFGNIPEFKKQETQIKQTRKKFKHEIPEEKLKKLSALPREEPSTNIRRLSNKLIYEIDLPGVKSLKDISIIELENSIEIKAISKNKAYFKLIPLNYPINDKKFSSGKLVLELDTK